MKERAYRDDYNHIQKVHCWLPNARPKDGKAFHVMIIVMHMLIKFFLIIFKFIKVLNCL